MSAENNVHIKNEDNPLLVFCSVKQLLHAFKLDIDNSIKKSTDQCINNNFTAMGDYIIKLCNFFDELPPVFKYYQYQDTYFAKVLGCHIDDKSNYSIQWFDKPYFIHSQISNKTMDEIYTENKITLANATRQRVLIELLLTRLETLYNQLIDTREITKKDIDFHNIIRNVIKESFIAFVEFISIYNSFINHIANQQKIEINDNVVDNLEEFISVEIHDCDTNGKMTSREIIMTRKYFNNIQKIKI